MKRAGFTMIELIFVIVILGILASVALPKLVGVKAQAHAAKAAELVSTLNSVVVSGLWGTAQIGNDGVVGDYLTALPNGDAKKTLGFYMEVPSAFSQPNTLNAALANAACTSSATTPVAGCQILADATNSLYIFVRDGNSTDAPRFWYSTKTAGAAGDFNVSKSSF